MNVKSHEAWVWCLRQESNLYLALRRRSFYPLNYGGMSALHSVVSLAEVACCVAGCIAGSSALWTLQCVRLGRYEAAS